MSYDYRIVGSDRIKSEDLKELLLEYGWQLIHGDAEANYFSFGKNKENPISCDISRLKEEDVEEALAQVTLAPKWQYVITVPLTLSKSEQTQAGKLAERLAKSIGGAAFDPQKDKILYPKGKKQRYTADLSQERINVIEMVWFLPQEQMKEEVCQQLLNQVAKILPEALPTRYGDREPLSRTFREGKGKKASNTAVEEFVRYTMEQKQAENMFYWKAERPCFWGSLSFGFKNYAKGREDALCTNIKLNFDARACSQDLRWIQILEKLFLQIATRLPIFYAMAYVNENVGVSKNGTLWFNGREKRYPISAYHWWSGIPGYPMWMSWFGRPYMNLVEDALQGFSYVREQNGFYLNTGLEQPKTMEMAEQHFPKLPRHLLSIREYGLKPDGRPSEYIYEDVPAEVIPDIRQI